MKRHTVRALAAAAVVAFAACKDKPTGPPPGTGIPAKVVEVAPTSHSALANANVGGTITVAVQDSFSNTVANQVVTFAIQAGGGTLIGQLTDTTDANGNATAPTWLLGKGADQQTIRVTSGTLPPLDINATVLTSYNIVVRFFNASGMTTAQQQLFTNAANRIMGIVTGDVADVQLTNQNISSCASGQGPLTEVVDDIVIYASISNIDGPGNILASSGPCFVRSGGANNKIPLMGVMQFDSNDLNTLSGNGSLQEVITHEMLHSLGVGSLWGSCGQCFNFVNGSGTADPQYNAPAAKAACQGVGGTVTCLNGVPLENTGGSGTKESHWRETNFANELMTGFINTSPNPLSAITIGSLVDLGYAVNSGDNDSYSLSAIMASLSAPNFGAAPALPRNWEHLNQVPLYSIDQRGNVRLVRKAQ